MAATISFIDTRQPIALELFKALGGSSESGYVTAPATEQLTASSSSYLSASSESIVERTETGRLISSIDEHIEQTKTHWSQLTDLDSDCDEVAEISNVEVFKALQMHPTWGTFFRTFGEGEMVASGELVMGKKFAEGSQRELYHAQVIWHDARNNEADVKFGREWVLTVFKGTFLKHLQYQWPQGLLQFHAERQELMNLGKPPPVRYNCDILGGILLKDGRFAFLMQREHEDLRNFIDRNMFRAGENHGPFSKGLSEIIMFFVAIGMMWLHDRNIIHRDLKASNVLTAKFKDGTWGCNVADFECSVGVVGTGFFRAPEILQACKDRNVSQKPEVFTKEADIYSYGMTCYEILTGRLPFEGHPTNDYDIVLNGQRPKVPDYVSEWTRILLRSCWQSNPANRPSFIEILNFLVSNSEVLRNDLLLERGLLIRQQDRHQEEKNVGA